MVESLSKGKALVVVIAASLVILVIALFITPGPLASVLYAVSAALFAIFLVTFVTWAKKNAGIQKGNFRELTQAVKRLEHKYGARLDAVSKHNEVFNTRLTAIEQSLKHQASFSPPVHDEREATFAVQSSPRENENSSLYSLNALPSAKVIKSNTPGAVGRKAAFIETEVASVDNLDIILNSGVDRWKKNVASILPIDVQERMSAKYNLVALAPNRTSTIGVEKFDYVVVDEHCSRQGRWAGFLETYRLGTYLELAETLRNARRSGAIVIVLEDPVASSLTNSIREFADIRLTPNSSQGHSQYESLEVCRELRELTALEEQARV